MKVVFKASVPGLFSFYVVPVLRDGCYIKKGDDQSGHPLFNTQGVKAKTS
jgi:hypothetical protein